MLPVELLQDKRDSAMREARRREPLRCGPAGPAGIRKTHAAL